MILDGWRITSNFQPSRKNPVTGKIEKHNGVDLVKYRGYPIPPFVSGKVIRRGFQEWGAGYYVVLECEDGTEQKYFHMDEILVSVGNELGYDSIIGLLGNTGNSTGAHLHFEVWENGEAIEPLEYLKRWEEKMIKEMKKLEERILKIENRVKEVPPPNWFVKAFPNWEKRILDRKGSYDFWRAITVAWKGKP